MERDELHAASQQFETLLAPALDAAYRLARSLTHNAADAEDLVQDAAVKAFRGFDSFQAGSNFKAWYLRILVNCFLNDKRRAQRTFETTELDGVPEQYLYQHARRNSRRGEDPAMAFLQRIDEESIARSFAALPDDFRIVAALYFLEEMTYEQIAEVACCPIGTVRSRLFRARRLLQKSLWDVTQE
jgi:RNA polymerase sigma-70 factor (ECF subfamily)